MDEFFPASAVHVAQDSIALGEHPLPGGIAAVVRWFFHVPQWIQIGGAVLAVVVGAAAAYVVWRQRRTLRQWVLTRSRGAKIALVVAVGAMGLAAAWSGAISWDYMQHDNGFCTGCHVMAPAFQRFTASEHDSLSCHDCHRQPLTASMRQLYLWVLDRPEEIGAHSPVPDHVCEDCHVTGESEVWQRIAATAGHRTHLESDSSVLANVMCVTCHGQEVHRFVPVDSTCAQADCHVNSTIALGPMQNQTSLHCATCHEFAAEVPILAARDSAAGTLVPNVDQCLSCHEMQAVLAEFDPARDPHSGTCGMCHNPHEQESAAEAAQTCATAACHGDWRAEPFHVGPRHVNVGESCILCHSPHQARVDASDCTGCHQMIADDPTAPAAVRRRLRRVAPFDTTRALERGASLFEHRPLGVNTRASPWAGGGVGDLLAGLPRPAAPAPADTFSHDQHDDLSCLTCHTTTDGHGGLTFEAPRGCQICHHQAPRESQCTQCHEAASLDTLRHTGTVRIAVADAPVRERPADFHHAQHAEVTCTDCHSAPVSLAVAGPVATCADCHDQHHDAGRSCVTCHASDDVAAAHAPPAEAHVRCDACHEQSTVTRLVPDRAFCLTCHQAQRRGHHAAKECTTCHMLAEPQTFRSRLTRGAR